MSRAAFPGASLTPTTASTRMPVASAGVPGTPRPRSPRSWNITKSYTTERQDETARKTLSRDQPINGRWQPAILPVLQVLFWYFVFCISRDSLACPLPPSRRERLPGMT